MITFREDVRDGSNDQTCDEMVVGRDGVDGLARQYWRVVFMCLGHSTGWCSGQSTNCWIVPSAQVVTSRSCCTVVVPVLNAPNPERAAVAEREYQVAGSAGRCASKVGTAESRLEIEDLDGVDMFCCLPQRLSLCRSKWEGALG